MPSGKPVDGGPQKLEVRRFRQFARVHMKASCPDGLPMNG
jgi:hypothetical protein